MAWTAVENVEIIYDVMEQVAAFCSFERFFGCARAVGALRFDVGRTSNRDLQVVGIPMIFTMSKSRMTPGLVNFTIKWRASARVRRYELFWL